MALGSAGLRARTSLVIALLVPIYVIVWLLVSKLQAPAGPISSWIATSFLILALVTASLHFVHGFTWARWAIGLFSLVVAGVQLLFILRTAPVAGVSSLQLLLVAVAGIIAANAVWLLGASTTKAFFETRRASITPRQREILRVLRWSLACLVLVGVATDLQRLFD